MTLFVKDPQNLVVFKPTLEEQDYNPVLNLLLNLSRYSAFNTPFAKTILKCSKPTLYIVLVKQPIRELLKRAAAFKECY